MWIQEKEETRDATGLVRRSIDTYTREDVK